MHSLKRQVSFAISFAIVALLICTATPLFAGSTRVIAAASGSDLGITEKDNPDPVLPNGKVTYTIVVTNYGPFDAYNVTINDYFYIPCLSACLAAKGAPGSPFIDPSELVPSSAPAPQAVDPMLVSMSGSGWSCNTSTATCTRPIMAAGESSLVLLVLKAPSQNGFLENDVYVSTTSFDPNSFNDYAYETTKVEFPCPPSVGALRPAKGATNVGTGGVLSWLGASPDTTYSVYLGPPLATGGCSQTLLGTTMNTSMPYSGLLPNTTYTWMVLATNPNCPTQVSSSCITFTTGGRCNDLAPDPLSPAPNDRLINPLTFSWIGVEGATSYNVYLLTNSGKTSQLIGSTSNTSLTTSVAFTGAYGWTVEAVFPSCGSTMATPVNFSVVTPGELCASPTAPVASIVGESTTDQLYHLYWTAVGTISSYEVEEGTTPDFAGSQPQSVTGTSAVFSHTATAPTPFYYRVRAICGSSAGPFSKSVRTVIVPKDPPESSQFHLTTEDGNTGPINQDLIIQFGPPNGKQLRDTTFTASSTVPWMTVNPPTGTSTGNSASLSATVNPSAAQIGTNSGAVVVTNSSSGSTLGSTTVSLNLGSPITPAGKDLPPPNALVIPAVADVQGGTAHWQSDIRMTNVASQTVKYQLTFTPSGPTGAADSKSTTFDVNGGQTVALDDIVKHLYGVGSLQDGTNGVLEIHPLTTGLNEVIGSGRLQLTTVAASRTYAAQGSLATLGQFIPAIPFVNFVGKLSEFDPTRPRALTMPQIVQNSAFRTNIGLLEGAGEPATVQISVYDSPGSLLKQFDVQLNPGEHQQLNSILAKQGLTLDDGRVDAQVVSDTGRITAYASVVDSRTNDSQLIPGVDVTTIESRDYVLPGVASLQSGSNNWKTDMRLYNAGTDSTDATLTLYPQGGAPVSKQVTIAGGETLVLNDVVLQLFGVTNVGGAIHISTSEETSLVGSARTYNDKGAAGTVGQFITAVTPDQAAGVLDRPLQLLQLEQSDRYRTNVGVAEVTGNSTTIEIDAILPGTLSAPSMQVTLQPNEFRQLNAILKTLGVNEAYNTRIAVSVVGGNGKVTAYASVVDNETQDPTYVPAQ